VTDEKGRFRNRKRDRRNRDGERAPLSPRQVTGVLLGLIGFTLVLVAVLIALVF
jgi:hypothetical protein